MIAILIVFLVIMPVGCAVWYRAGVAVGKRQQDRLHERRMQTFLESLAHEVGVMTDQEAAE